jgi:hypothetical protein
VPLSSCTSTPQLAVMTAASKGLASRNQSELFRDVGIEVSSSHVGL